MSVLSPSFNEVRITVQEIKEPVVRIRVASRAKELNKLNMERIWSALKPEGCEHRHVYMVQVRALTGQNRDALAAQPPQVEASFLGGRALSWLDLDTSSTTTQPLLIITRHECCGGRPVTS